MKTQENRSTADALDATQRTISLAERADTKKPQSHADIQGVKPKNGKAGDKNKARMPTNPPPLLLVLVMDRTPEVVPRISRKHRKKVRTHKRKQSRRKMYRRSHKQNRNSKLHPKATLTKNKREN